MNTQPSAVLEGTSSRAILDLRAQTLTFEHHGSIATDEQKSLSPLIIPLGAIAEIECRPGRSTNWFWVVRRDRQRWRDEVWKDPYAVVSVESPVDFVEQLRAAVARAEPIDEPVAPDAPHTPPSKAGRFRRWMGRAVVDGFFNAPPT